MCGITAIISPESARNAVLSALNQMIRHRGPDDEGYVIFKSTGEKPEIYGGNDTPDHVYSSQYDHCPKKNISEFPDNTFAVGLGQRRLAIIDLSDAGHNPLSYDKGRYWITYNGEVYNYVEIRDELRSKGHSFCTRTDTEVILAAFAEWGKECLGRFRGMWAFVIYDALKGEIFIARDRYGIKPLYYYTGSDGTIYFASEIKQFTQVPGWVSKLNHEKALHYLIYNCNDHTDESMFRDVKQIRGGHMLLTRVVDLKTDRNGKLPVTKWYNPGSESFKGSREDAVFTFRQLFKESVVLHMRSDVTVGAALSGGLDSSAVVGTSALMRKESGDMSRQPVYSSCSIYPEFDERRWMEIMVNTGGLDPNYIYPTALDAFETMDKMIWNHDLPYDTQSAFLGFKVFEEVARTGVKVILNGQGSDEYLGGYSQFLGSHLWSLAGSMHFKEAWNEMKSFHEFHNYTYRFQVNRTINFIMPSGIKSLVSKYANRNKEELGVLDLKKFPHNHIRPYDLIPLQQDSRRNIADLFTFYNPLPKYLRWEDRNSMAHGVECRVPFLDHHLVEFVNSLPVDFIQHGGMSKGILREAMKDIIPNEIRYRKDKKGFITPEQMWMKKEVSHLYRSYLKESIGACHGLIKDIAIKKLENIILGKDKFTTLPWRIILFGRWVRLFEVKVD